MNFTRFGKFEMCGLRKLTWSLCPCAGGSDLSRVCARGPRAELPLARPLQDQQQRQELWGTESRILRYRVRSSEVQSQELWGTESRTLRYRVRSFEEQSQELWGTESRTLRYRVRSFAVLLVKNSQVQIGRNLRPPGFWELWGAGSSGIQLIGTLRYSSSGALRYIWSRTLRCCLSETLRYVKIF
jgi:hypothetical protein